MLKKRNLVHLIIRLIVPIHLNYPHHGPKVHMHTSTTTIVPLKFNEKLLPVPGPYKQTRSTTDNVLQAGIASVKEGYTPPFLKCTSMQRKAPCQSVESYEPQDNIASLEIDFYGSQGCGWCKKAKDLLNKEGVLDKVTYKDASQHADELRSISNEGGVPPLFIRKKQAK